MGFEKLIPLFGFAQKTAFVRLSFVVIVYLVYVYMDFASHLYCYALLLHALNPP